MASTYKATETKRAVGYFRVSTLRQAGERHVSLETQRSASPHTARRQAA